MSDTYEDDFPRIPNRIIDNDKASNEAFAEMRETPDEQHDADMETMLRNRAAMDSAALGEGEDAVVLSHDQKEFDKIVSEPAPDNTTKEASQATAQSTAQAPGLDPAGAPAAPAQDSQAADAVKNAGGAPGDVQRPSGVDEALGAIRQRDNSHQRRFVIVGDPDIKRHFMDTLAAEGKVKYQNGVPVIGLNRKAAIKLLQEIAEKHGAGAEHALHMTAKREGRGLGAVTAAIKQAVTGRHTVDVVVVGSAEVRAEKKKELGDTLERMRDDKQFTPRGDGKNLPVKEGDLVLPKVSEKEGSRTRPVVLESSVTLTDLLRRSKDNVDAWKREVQQQKDARNGPKDGKSDGSKDANGKDAGKEPGKDAAAAPNGHAIKNADKLQEAFANPASLSETKTVGKPPKEREQVAAEGLLRGATVFKDPATKEIATLPVETRQQMLVHLTALATKVDDKDFGAAARKALDEKPYGRDGNPPEDPRTVREKLADYLKQEASMDPQFAEKPKALTASLVEQGILTKKQASHVNEQIADAVASHAAGSAQANAQTSAAADAARAPGSAATGKDSVASQEANPASGVTTAATASSGAASREAVKDAAKESAPGSATAQESVTTAAQGTNSHAAGAPDTAEPGSGKATPGVSTGDSFSARLADAFKDGPAVVTVEQARGIINELETRREQPLATLSAGESAAAVPGASRTLTQVKNVLLNASMGQFGEDLASKADTLHSAVREWSRQESDRIAAVKLKGSASRDTEAASSADSSATPVTPLKATDSVTQVSTASRASTREASDRSSDGATAPVDAAAQSRDAAPNAGVRVARMQAGSGADAEQQSPRSSGQPAASSQKADHAPSEVKGTSSPAHVAEHGRAGSAHAGAATDQTRGHAETLYKLMGNPAGSFTRRDKSWNTANITKAAQAIAGLDLRETAKLSSAQRSTLAAYTVWLGDAANAGKIPGFTSESGKQLAAQVAEKASGLIKQVDGPLPASTVKEVTRAERMVDAKLEHDLKLSKTADLFRDAPAGARVEPNGNAKALAQDLVHAVYRQSEMTEGYANYLLKSAAQLSPESLRGLDPDTKARTVAALSYLAGEVRNGAMGEFDHLSSGVQRNVLAAQTVVDKLHDSLGREPGMPAAFTKAYLEVNRSEIASGKATEKEASASGNLSRTDTLPAPAGNSLGKSDSELSGRTESRTGGDSGRSRAGSNQDMER